MISVRGMARAGVVAAMVLLVGGAAALGAPIASFSVNPNPAHPSQNLAFDGSGSSAGVIWYEWDFNYDGTFESQATGVTVVHAYNAFGTYQAALRVLDDSLPTQMDIATRLIYVNQGNIAPYASAGGPYLSFQGVSAHLDGSHSYDVNAGMGDSIVVYAWDLNQDGNYSDASGVAPTVSWPQLQALGIGSVGLHPISLRVVDMFGAMGHASTTLTLLAPEPATLSLLALGGLLVRRRRR